MANPKPEWCPHGDCQYVVSFQDVMCGGKLLSPIFHEDAFNTHRVCFDTRETGHGICDLMINKTDSYYFTRLFKTTIER